MTQWMGRHKLLTTLAAVLLLGSCGSVLGDDPDTDAPAAKPQVAGVKDSASPSPSPAEEAAVPEPTPQEVWAANYDASRTPYVESLAAILALAPRSIDAQSGSLAACRSLDENQSLDARVDGVRELFALTTVPTYEQALAALDATASIICPELATIHQTQTADRAKRLQAQERRRQERERRRKEREAPVVEAPAPQVLVVLYENCTAVEEAGAAPIRAGDPGYSRDLDRDGDGVACEQ